MASKTVQQFFDDVDGEPVDQTDVQTVTFGLDGQQFEIDLRGSNAEALREMLAKYITAGRRVGGYKKSQPQRQKTIIDYDRADLMKWAESEGIEVSARGRVALDTVAKYKAAKDAGWTPDETPRRSRKKPEAEFSAAE